MRDFGESADAEWTAVYAGNRLMQSSSSGQTITYDNAGNMQSNPDMGATMTYDGEGRQLTWSGGGANGATYDYDGEGRRVRKTVTGTSTGVTYFVYDATGQLAEEVTPAGSDPDGGTTTYLTDDHLGSTRLVTDAAGVFKQRWDYLPFGQLIPGAAAYGNRDQMLGYPAAAPASGVDLEFTGKERDGETGLDYFGARYLSGVMGGGRARIRRTQVPELLIRSPGTPTLRRQQSA